MPTEEHVGLEDEERLLPVFDATGKDEPETIGLRKGRLLNLAVKNDELLAEEGILGDQFGFTACHVDGSTEHNRMVGGLSEMQGGIFKESNETNDESGQPVE
jgi:hypothetical protein